MRVEEELVKYQKTHEDEVNLRLKFEEKLNNLHALNRMTNQNLFNTAAELENISKAHTDMQVSYKQLLLELNQEKVKS